MIANHFDSYIDFEFIIYKPDDEKWIRIFMSYLFLFDIYDYK